MIVIVKNDRRLIILGFGNCIYIKQVISAINKPINLLGREPDIVFKS